MVVVAVVGREGVYWKFSKSPSRYGKQMNGRSTHTHTLFAKPIQNTAHARQKALWLWRVKFHLCQTRYVSCGTWALVYFCFVALFRFLASNVATESVRYREIVYYTYNYYSHWKHENSKNLPFWWVKGGHAAHFPKRHILYTYTSSGVLLFCGI